MGGKQLVPRLSNITLAEWRFVAIILALVLLLTTAPYVYAYVSTPADKQFMGIMLDVPDHAQYFSWMRELSDSSLASNKMTPEPNDPVFFNLLWWGLGHLKRWSGMSLDLTFQVFRILSSIFFLISAYWVVAHFLPEQRRRRTAFLVIVFGSGFGWVLVLLKYTLTRGTLLFPLDVFIAEGNTFLGLMAYPHFIAAMLYVIIFILFLLGKEKGQLRYAVAAGLLAQFLGWQHAYDLILVYGILGAFVVAKAFQTRSIPRFSLLSLVVICVLSFWPALYSVLLTALDPVWGMVLAQFDNAGVFTPNLLHLPILMGPAFLLALAGFITQKPLRLQEKDDARIMLLVWFSMNFLLIYLPTDYQIHMLNGWQVPTGILATLFVYETMIPRITAWRPVQSRAAWFQRSWVIPLLMVGLVVPTNLYLWSWRFVELRRHTYPFYLEKDEVRALAWLDQNASDSDVVLSSLTIGQFVPAWTGARAYLAHWAQTLDFFSKRQDVQVFFSPDTSPDERKAILDDGSVDFVFYGPVEREQGSLPLLDLAFLTEVYSSGNVSVLRVAGD